VNDASIFLPSAVTWTRRGRVVSKAIFANVILGSAANGNFLDDTDDFRSSGSEEVGQLETEGQPFTSRAGGRSGTNLCRGSVNNDSANFRLVRGIVTSVEWHAKRIDLR